MIPAIEERQPFPRSSLTIGIISIKIKTMKISQHEEEILSTLKVIL